MLKVYLASSQIEDRDAVRRKLIGLEYQLERAVAATAARAAEEARDREMRGGALTFGVPASGALSAGDSVMRDGSYYDVWSFPGTAGQRIRIRMVSSSYRPVFIFRWVTLGNRRGVAEADVTLTETATYTIKVNSEGTGAKTGPYSISVELIQAGRRERQ